MLLEVVELEIGHLESGLHNPKVMEIGQIALSVENVNGKLMFNVTTESPLAANMFYRATVITTMGMIKIGSILFCKWVT